MAASLKLFPGNAIRWHDQWYLIVDCEGLDAVIGTFGNDHAALRAEAGRNPRP
ncbi:MAG TPA: hypothetical protein VHZ07_04430 [Bryobacteraceae bacterium]|jgi:hypothetical protein|nr:hypothetical protein [Bryobacteraceae bacterium]